MPGNTADTSQKRFHFLKIFDIIFGKICWKKISLFKELVASLYRGIDYDVFIIWLSLQSNRDQPMDESSSHPRTGSPTGELLFSTGVSSC